MKVIPSLQLLIKSSFVLLLITLFSGCRTYSEDDKSSFDTKIASYIRKKGWDMTKSESGLYLQELEVGTGEEVVIFGSEVTISYKGTLLNGSIFDQTPPNKPLKSNLKGLIMGFQEGLLGRKKGSKFRLVVPPQLGYGDMALDKIPENSVLVFELELVDLH